MHLSVSPSAAYTLVIAPASLWLYPFNHSSAPGAYVNNAKEILRVLLERHTNRKNIDLTEETTAQVLGPRGKAGP
jgi:hypothetical protein